MISTRFIRNGHGDVVERQRLKKLLDERNLSDVPVAPSPCEAGKLLGLGSIVPGSVAEVGRFAAQIAETDPTGLRQGRGMPRRPIHVVVRST